MLTLSILWQGPSIVGFKIATDQKKVAGVEELDHEIMFIRKFSPALRENCLNFFLAGKQLGIRNQLLRDTEIYHVEIPCTQNQTPKGTFLALSSLMKVGGMIIEVNSDRDVTCRFPSQDTRVKRKEKKSREQPRFFLKTA